MLSKSIYTFGAVLVVCCLWCTSPTQAGVITKGGKIAAKKAVAELTEEVGKKAVRATIKEGGAQVTKKMTQKELISLVGSEPVERMSKLLDMRNIDTAVDIAAHNPSKEKIWKVMADCAELEKTGGNVRSYMASAIDASDGFIKVNGDSLYTMYRYARFNKLTTPENVELMSKGLAPRFVDGQVAHLDHIIPVKYAPELKTLPANLRILKASENTSRQAAIDNHCKNKVKQLTEELGSVWKPNAELQEALK